MFIVNLLLPLLVRATDSALILNRDGLLVSLDHYETPTLSVLDRVQDNPLLLETVLLTETGHHHAFDRVRVVSEGGWSPHLMHPFSRGTKMASIPASLLYKGQGECEEKERMFLLAKAYPFDWDLEDNPALSQLIYRDGLCPTISNIQAYLGMREDEEMRSMLQSMETQGGNVPKFQLPGVPVQPAIKVNPLSYTFEEQAKKNPRMIISLLPRLRGIVDGFWLSNLLLMLPNLDAVPDDILRVVFQPTIHPVQLERCLNFILSDNGLLDRLAAIHGVSEETFAKMMADRLAPTCKCSANDLMTLFLAHSRDPTVFFQVLRVLSSQSRLIFDWMRLNQPMLGWRLKVDEYYLVASNIKDLSIPQAHLWVSTMMTNRRMIWKDGPIAKYWNLHPLFVAAVKDHFYRQLLDDEVPSWAHWEHLMIWEPITDQGLLIFEYLIRLLNHQMPLEANLRHLQANLKQELDVVAAPALHRHEAWLVTQPAPMITVYLTLLPHRSAHLLKLAPTVILPLAHHIYLGKDPDALVEAVFEHPHLVDRATTALIHHEHHSHLRLLKIRQALLGGIYSDSWLEEALLDQRVYLSLRILENLPAKVTYGRVTCSLLKKNWSPAIRRARPVFLERLKKQLESGCNE